MQTAMQSDEGHDTPTLKTATSAIFLSSASSIAFALFKMPPDLIGMIIITNQRRIAEASALAAPLIFLAAAALVCLRPRLGYGLGLFAGLAALPWFVWTELSFWPWANSWIALNLANPTFPEYRVILAMATWKILAVALIVTAIACSFLRLLPRRWTWRKTAWRRRTWPAFAVSFLVLTTWFLHSVTPYRLPGIVDQGAGPEFRILHVEKRGTRFRETEVSVARDGQFWVSRTDRRLLEYRFQTIIARGVLAQVPLDHARAFAQSSEFSGLRTGPAKALRSWNVEGCYVLKDSQLLAFTSEYGAAPPPGVRDLLQEIKAEPTTDSSWWPMQDVCLGFCYDPRAGLGFLYANQRCLTQPDGATGCQ